MFIAKLADFTILYSPPTVPAEQAQAFPILTMSLLVSQLRSFLMESDSS
jgi:hypothetical protein